MRKVMLTATAIIGLAGAMCLPASGATTKVKPKVKERKFTEVIVGSRLSTTGSRYEDVYRVKSSPDGGGAAIQDAALKGSTYPVGAQDTMTAFFRDGAQTTSDTFTLGPPSVDGIGAISGNGTCIRGSGIHLKETCTFTIKGSYDLQTSVVKLILTGTYTRPTATTPASADRRR